MCWTEILTSYETGGVLLGSWNTLYKKLPMRPATNQNWATTIALKSYQWERKTPERIHMFFGGGDGGGSKGSFQQTLLFYIYISWAFSTRKRIYLSSNSKAILKGNPSNKSNFYLQKVYSDEKKKSICYGKIMFWHLKKIKFFCGQNYD